MPSISIKPMVDAVLDLGLKPVFIDIELETFCFKVDDLKNKINKNTKGILITYLFGMVPDIKRIIEISRKSNLFIIEDFSQCLNGEFQNKKVGTFGDIGVYSSSTTKTLDTYGGGICVTNNKSIYELMKIFEDSLTNTSRFRLFKNVVTDFVRNMATNFKFFNLITFPLILFFEKFLKKNVKKYVGERDLKSVENLPKFWFEKYSSFQSKVGLYEIKNLVKKDEKRIKNVNSIISSNKHLVKKLKLSGDRKHVFWQFILLVKNVDYVRELFQENRIDTSTSSLILLSNLEYIERTETPNANFLLQNGLFIPTYPSLNQKHLKRIKNVLNSKEVLIN